MDILAEFRYITLKLVKLNILSLIISLNKLFIIGLKAQKQTKWGNVGGK